MGVTSVIAVTSRPVASSARIAASRPAPGPRTKTSTVFIPESSALRAAFSAAICAAYGVLLREPFQPDAPADDHAMTFPAGSLIEMMVLLKVAFTCAAPRGMTRRSRFLRGATFSGVVSLVGPSVTVPSSRSRLRHRLLLAGDGLARALARARVRTRALAAHRKAATVPQPAVAAGLLKALDVHRDLAAEVTLDGEGAIDDLADLRHLGLGEITDADRAVDTCLLEDLPRGR